MDKNSDLHNALTKQGISEELINNADVAFIYLGKGKFTIVDSWNQFWLMNLCSWYYDLREYEQEYAVGRMNKRHVYMHRIIAKKIGLDLSFLIDHENNNGLYNREINLRAATHSQNNYNSKKPITNTSNEKGITHINCVSPWMVRIQKEHKTYYIGCYKTLKEAIKSRNEAYIKYHGKEFMRLE